MFLLGFKVDDNKKLGEWAGLCKIDKEGKARKVVGCSCVVVKVSKLPNPVIVFLILLNILFVVIMEFESSET